jgi:HEAT repeat protein
MNKNILQAPVFLIAPLLFLCVLFAGGRGQETDLRTDQLRQELLSRLASGDEEQRIDSIVRIGALLRDEPDSAEASIIKSLGAALQRDSSPVVRALAARALEICAGNRGGQNNEAVAALLVALKKEREMAVRKAIIYALANYSHPEITSALTPFLQNKNAELRASAAYALAENGDPASARALAEVLRRSGKDEDAFARSQAARGLGRVGGRDSIDLLTNALSNDRSQEVRREAARALGRTATSQDQKAVEALRNAILSNDPYLVGAAEEAIASINSRNP